MSDNICTMACSSSSEKKIPAVQLAKNPIVLKYDLTSVRILGCGAAPLGKEHIDALAKRMPALLRQG